MIYDTGDIKTLIKDCIKELGYNEKEIDPRFAMSQISDAKNKMLEPATMVYTCGNDLKLQAVAKIYALYQKKLMKNNALDFDDIIFNISQNFQLRVAGCARRKVSGEVQIHNDRRVSGYG